MSLPKRISRSIMRKMEDIAKDPLKKNNNAEKLQGVDGFRLRHGDWRVIYKVEKGIVIVVVVKIETRGEVYKK